MTTHVLGRLSIEFRDTGEISRYLRSEFSVLPVGKEAPDIVCQEVDSLQLLGDFETRNGRIWIATNGYRIDFPNLSASVLEECGQTIVRFFVKTGNRRHRVLQRKPEGIQRMANWNYLSVAEENAKAVIYDVLDQVIQVRQNAHSQTFLHCSAIEKDGDVYIIAGWGGVGKTSSVMSLISENGFRFLSDDLGILDDSGVFFRSPKRIQIYPYNLEGADHLKAKLLGKRPLQDRLHWAVRLKYRGHKGVRRRVSAEEFFGQDSVASYGKVKGFIHLERGNYPEIAVGNLMNTEAATRTSHILVHELSPIAEIGAAMGGAQIRTPYATEQWRSASESILSKALADVPCAWMTVPEATGPSELAQEILRAFEL